MSWCPEKSKIPEVIWVRIPVPSNFEISVAINIKSEKIVNNKNSSFLTARSRNAVHIVEFPI
jgi:hypothetical protein